jgi:hypothetical protein
MYGEWPNTINGSGDFMKKSADDRCGACSFQPTSLNDYCDEHRPYSVLSVSKRKPINAKSENTIGKLPRDNYPPEVGHWSILLSPDHVALHLPEGGGWAEIPRKEFDRLARWYVLGQETPIE